MTIEKKKNIKLLMKLALIGFHKKNLINDVSKLQNGTSRN